MTSDVNALIAVIKHVIVTDHKDAEGSRSCKVDMEAMLGIYEHRLILVEKDTCWECMPFGYASPIVIPACCICLVIISL